jgi:hypothetical protein
MGGNDNVLGLAEGVGGEMREAEVGRRTESYILRVGRMF